MRILEISALLIVSLVSHTRILYAQPCGGTLDQHQDVVNQFQGGPLPGWTRAQTFLVGSTGQLVQIDYHGDRGRPDLYPNDTLTIEIRRTVAGVPNESPAGLLVSRKLPAAPLPPYSNWIAVSFPQGPSVSSGELLALVISIRQDATTWTGGQHNIYPAGRAMTRTPNDSSWHIIGSASGEYDYAFRTYVCQVVPVVESTWGQIKMARQPSR